MYMEKYKILVNLTNLYIYIYIYLYIYPLLSHFYRSSVSN